MANPYADLIPAKPAPAKRANPYADLVPAQKQPSDIAITQANQRNSAIVPAPQQPVEVAPVVTVPKIVDPNAQPGLPEDWNRQGVAPEVTAQYDARAKRTIDEFSKQPSPAPKDTAMASRVAQATFPEGKLGQATAGLASNPYIAAATKGVAYTARMLGHDEYADKLDNEINTADAFNLEERVNPQTGQKEVAPKHLGLADAAINDLYRMAPDLPIIMATGSEELALENPVANSTMIGLKLAASHQIANLLAGKPTNPDEIPETAAMFGVTGMIPHVPGKIGMVANPALQAAGFSVAGAAEKGRLPNRDDLARYPVDVLTFGMMNALYGAEPAARKGAKAIADRLPFESNLGVILDAFGQGGKLKEPFNPNTTYTTPKRNPETGEVIKGPDGKTVMETTTGNAVWSQMYNHLTDDLQMPHKDALKILDRVEKLVATGRTRLAKQYYEAARLAAYTKAYPESAQPDSEPGQPPLSSPGDASPAPVSPQAGPVQDKVGTPDAGAEAISPTGIPSVPVIQAEAPAQTPKPVAKFEAMQRGIPGKADEPWYTWEIPGSPGVMTTGARAGAIAAGYDAPEPTAEEIKAKDEDIAQRRAETKRIVEQARQEQEAAKTPPAPQGAPETATPKPVPIKLTGYRYKKSPQGPYGTFYFDNPEDTKTYSEPLLKGGVDTKRLQFSNPLIVDKGSQKGLAVKWFPEKWEETDLVDPYEADQLIAQKAREMGHDAVYYKQLRQVHDLTTFHPSPELDAVHGEIADLFDVKDRPAIRENLERSKKNGDTNFTTSFMSKVPLELQEKRAQALIKLRRPQPATSKTTPKLVSAAVKTPDGKVVQGPNHPAIDKTLGKPETTREQRNRPEYGFVDDNGQFVTREQATEIAKASGQALQDFEEGHPLHSDQVESATEPGKTIAETEQPVAAVSTPKLPQQLAGAKPRYGYGSKLFTLDFESDLDKALYTIANSAKRSKADAAYLQWVMSQKPGATEQELRAAGDKVRAAIKAKAAISPAGNLTIPHTSPAESPAIKAATTPPPAKEGEKPKTRIFRQKYSPDKFGDDPLVALIKDSGGLMSKTTARARGKLEKNASLWDDAPSLSHPSHNKVYRSEGGLMPDEMAQIAHNAGLIPEADASSLWSGIDKASKGARKAIATEKQFEAQSQVADKQTENFNREVLSKGTGAKPTPASDLNVGDVVNVETPEGKTEKIKVMAVDADSHEVTLEDGKKYGVQIVNDDDILYTESVEKPMEESDSPEFQVDDKLIWSGPGGEIEVSYRGDMGGKAFIYNPKSGWQGQTDYANLRKATEKPDLALESPTEDQLNAEKAAAVKKSELEKGLAKPLTGTAGDMSGDMFDRTKAENPLFAPPAPKPVETTDTAKPTEVSAPKNAQEALHQGKKVKLPSGANAVLVRSTGGGYAKALTKNLDTLQGGGPYTSAKPLKVSFTASGSPKWNEAEDVKGKIEVATDKPVKHVIGGASPETLEQEAPVVPLEKRQIAGASEGEAETIPEPEKSPTSLKNEIVDEERKKRGLEPAMAIGKRSFGLVWDRAMFEIDHNPQVVDRLLDDLRTKPRALTDREDALLLHRQVEWQNALDKAAQDLIDARFNGDVAGIVEARTRANVISDQLQDLYNIGKSSGTETGRGLNARKMLVKEDFSLARMITQKRAANEGKELTEKQEAQITELQDKILATQKAYDEYIAASEERIRKLEADKFIQRAKQPEPKSKGKPKDPAKEQTALIRGIKEGISEGAQLPDLTNFIQRLAKSFIRQGITEREPLVDKVHEILKSIVPTIERRETMDAISGYGDFKQLSKDQVDVKLRDLKGQMQQVAKLQDMQAGQAPAKTGVERRAPSDEERRLIKEVEKAKREGGYRVTDPGHQLKTALESVKTRLKNQIKDLNHQIETGEKPVRKGGIVYDLEADKLKALRDQVKQTLEDIEGKPELTDEQRVKMATSALEKSIAEYERRIKEGDLTPAKGKSQTPSTPELEALRTRRDALREEIQELRDLAAPKKTPEERALQSLKTRLAHNIADMAEKLANEDYSTKQKSPVSLDEEAIRLKAENERLKQQFREGLQRDRLTQRSGVEKVEDTFVKWRRAFLLSSPVTLAKLTSAAAERMIFTPAEEAAGYAIGKFIPGIASKASRHGGLSIEAESKALTDGFTKGMADGWKVLRTGKSDLDALYGREQLVPPDAIDFIGNIHGMLKQPAKRNEFARAFQKRAKAAMVQGLDVTEPLVQTKIAIEAYKDANRSIFMQDNRVVDAYKRAISALEQVDKKTGKPPLWGKTAATAGRAVLPIVKVPTNIVGEALEYAIGTVTGSARAGRAYAKGVENLEPEEADLIMRLLKKGLLGASILLLGFFNPKSVGGYFQPGKKRDPRDVPFGSIRVFGHDIPSFIIHNPLLEMLQLGATIRRVADSRLKKKDVEPQGLTSGAIAGALGLLEEVPFVRETTDISNLNDPFRRGATAGNMVQGLVVPQVSKYVAEKTDTTPEGQTVIRKPQSLLDYVKMGIPGMRETVRTPTEDEMKRLNAQDAVAVYLRLPPADRQKFQDLVQDKIDRSRTLTEDEQNSDTQALIDAAAR